MRRSLPILLAGAFLVLAGTTTAAPEGAFTNRGTVVKVVDGDTVDVRLTTGKTERVRLIGVDTPERGACFFAQASARARKLALRKRVVLRGDATQATRDRYGRLLAYVWLPGGKDLGYALVGGGYGEVYVYGKAFKRLSAYRKAEDAAQSRPRGIWKSCGARKPTVPPKPVAASGSCHPSYSPCLPIVGDLNCPDVRALGKAPVRILGSDPYRLDGDGDGWGCE